MRRRYPPRTIALAGLLALAGCSPALDWREFEPDGSGVAVTFPCRPDRHARVVKVAEMSVGMSMLVCTASDTTFAVAYFDTTGPAGVAPALADLQAVARANVGGGEGVSSPVRVPGMTPQVLAARLRLNGRRPDGAPVQEQAVFFAKGLRVYQATVIGRALSDDAVDVFFAGLKLPS